MTNCDNCGEDLVYSANWYEVKYGPEAFGITRFLCEKCSKKDLTIYVEQDKEDFN